MDLHELIEACRDVTAGDDPATHVAEILGRFLRQRDVTAHVGTAERSMFEAIHRSDDLLLLYTVIPPTPTPVDPQNHRMWVVVGVYHGQEDNQLFTRTDDDTLEPTERSSLAPGDVRALDEAAIHSIQPGRSEYSERSTSTAATCSPRRAAPGPEASNGPWTSPPSRSSSAASASTKMSSVDA